MCDNYRSVSTLVKGRSFIWCRDAEGTLTVQAGLNEPVRATFTAEQYAAALDLIASNPAGTPLGARADEEGPAGSLGRLMSEFGKSRPHASWIAAIAVDEGFAEADYRGPRGGGLWLLAVPEGHDRAIDEIVDQVGKADADGIDFDENSPGSRPDPARTADGLRAIADRVFRAEQVDQTMQVFDLADIVGAASQQALEKIDLWERELPDARYLYRFRVVDAALASRCRDALAMAKSGSFESRRFSRINDAPAGSACLYVGSSRSLVSRVRQHLGLAHRGTYAMQVCHWQADAPLEGLLQIDVWRYAPGVDDAVLQALEDDLWLAEHPRFGRMGAR